MAQLRTDFASAVTKTLRVLETGEAYSQNKLAEKAELNIRTVQKILQHIIEIQKYLNNQTIDVSILESAKIIRMREKSGLSSFPENIQKLILKTAYYPTVSNEETILVHLLMNKAISKQSAIVLPEDSFLKQLIRGEQIVKTSNEKFYLTEEGKIIAFGALKLYPELRQIVSKTEPTLEDGLSDWIKHHPKEANDE